MAENPLDAFSEMSSNLKVLITTLVFPAIVGIWKGFSFLLSRKDEQKKEELSREEKLLREVENQRTAMTRDQAAFMGDIRAELLRSYARIEVVEKEREDAEKMIEYWAERARGWKTMAHDLKHDLNNARVTISAAYVQLGREYKEWPFEVLPSIDDILAFIPAYMERKKKWMDERQELIKGQPSVPPQPTN